MISEQTQKDVIQVITDWCKDTYTNPDKIQDLFRRLAEVKGNKSFETSIRAIRNTLRETKF
jgi:hypothetical protein